MSKESPMKLPLPLLILDGIGAVLAGIGLAERLADTNLVPAALQFEDYDLVMVIVGVALMIPMFRHIIGAARARGASGRRPP